ncbi:MAG TPA: class I tRNA ligase family protein, partial [Actinomycetota bacterium]|nr:class I tRNA ligase family protein [Actinomycetota bacterium]
MFKQVPNRADLVKGEHEILEFWEEDETFEKLRKKNAGNEHWSFLDGPITANNPMGVHHAWGRTYKDAFQRFFAMKGRDQRWQNGFDCQGLWVEVEVEKELGFNSKRDIEEYGLEKFINACKERVFLFADMMTKQSIRLGMWMDWPNSYFTMSDENNYTIWSFLKKCHERGLIYKGLDAMPWCPRCGTGISEQERKEGYEEVEDEAVYVRFPLKGRDREFLLVWTTTPWTLAANVAAAVNPDLTYLKVRQGEDLYYVSAGRRDVFKSEAKRAGDPEVIGEIKGAEMIGWGYTGPFDELPAAAGAVDYHRVIEWEEVSDSSGTGIVHIAPGCGKEDFDLGKQNSLPVIAPIDDSGNYIQGFGALTSKYAGDVAPDVYASLKEKGLFYKRERYTHDYPHCWRCHTPLLFRAVDEWYIDMGWREQIKEVVKQINWVPSYFKELELDWLKNMGDWMISKKRYWGLALPIWECSDCGHFEVLGSKEELEQRAVSGWEEFEGHTPHRPWVDAVQIACAGCGGQASRIPDVGNPWLDAGIVPYSTL